MASELAQKISDAVVGGMKYFGSKNPPYDIPAVVDAELAEVREVLDGLRSMGSNGCWCVFPVQAQATGKHTEPCQRARALYDKLKVE